MRQMLGCGTDRDDMESEENSRRFDCSRITSPFCLRHSRVNDFTTSPCFRCPLVLCVFRAVAALYLTSWWLYNISAHIHKGKMFIYYSNTCFTVISFYFVIGFNLSSISIRQQRDEIHQKNGETPETEPVLRSKESKDEPRFDHSEDKEATVSEVIFSEDDSAARGELLSPRIEVQCNIRDKSIIEEYDEESCSITTPGISKTTRKLSVCYKIYWLFFYISSNTSVLLAIGYLTGFLEDHTSYPNTITKHVVPLCLVVMDLLISGIPVYMSHILYPIIFTLAYYIFTICYWAAGGTDPNGRAYIYNALNYDHLLLKQAFIPALTIILVQPLIHFGFYIVSTARRFLEKKACHKNYK